MECLVRGSPIFVDVINALRFCNVREIPSGTQNGAYIERRGELAHVREPDATHFGLEATE